MLFKTYDTHHQPKTLKTQFTNSAMKVENHISAQDLKPITPTMETYVVAWIDPNRKGFSRIDTKGGVFPTWNDKVVFMVDEERLLHDYSCSTLVFEIYAVGRFGDKLVGTATVLLENFINRSSHRDGMKGSFRAIQVRRPSGTPQGILNIGVTVLDPFSYNLLLGALNKRSPLDYDYDDYDAPAGTRMKGSTIGKIVSIKERCIKKLIKKKFY
ncbi:hypothetical protein HS088_TW15G00237 [Tripterygium wilfordii]|uniref:C2 domain-containing protein n=1 Tax=Tripterygium wilfordii TaxID=458696 RepID=A0A7J7CL05_TRIWF|nr:uncharacterized protein LOC120016819 [Tripterygium wilfordii]XP_038725672.1 uncharacterized protein LOC120016819 [Tripterygium wilfordii]KAF5734745.1 hypothetical protein HS088_TW15G00237 [Tripterygium wilfordii]